jgi:hypothetical protein
MYLTLTFARLRDSRAELLLAAGKVTNVLSDTSLCTIQVLTSGNERRALRASVLDTSFTSNRPTITSSREAVRFLGATFIAPSPSDHTYRGSAVVIAVRTSPTVEALNRIRSGVRVFTVVVGELLGTASNPTGILYCSASFSNKEPASFEDSSNDGTSLAESWRDRDPEASRRLELKADGNSKRIESSVGSVRKVRIGPRRELNLQVETWPEGRHRFGRGHVVTLRFGAISNFAEVQNFFAKPPAENLHYMQYLSESHGRRHVIEMEFDQTEQRVS